MRSSLGEESQGYEPRAPRERPESQPAWPQPSGPQYGMPFAPWVSPMPMQPAMPPFMPMMPMPVPYLPPVTPQPQARGPSPFAAHFFASSFFMVYSFNLSYLEKFFVVFYLSSCFILARRQPARTVKTKV